MANLGFNGTTVSFASTAGVTANPLRSVTYSNSPAEVDVSGSTDSTHKYTPGMDNETLTYELVGAASIVNGSTGTVTVSWNDGNSDSFRGVIMTHEHTGSMDGELLTSVTIRPSTNST